LPTGNDLTFQRGHWGGSELGIQPPVSLLSWLIRNPSRLTSQPTQSPDRKSLFQGDPDATARALDLLRSQSATRAWYIFEGPTFPDAFIETPDAIVVVEGKRTEPGPTTSTTWLAGRHQIWRHIDAAWERRGRRHVFGFFAVEGRPEDGAVPLLWQQATEDCVSPSALATSFPHRSAAECDSIASCFLGATSWQAICRTFGLQASVLKDHV
jgi:hypothetical protein